MKAVAAIGMTLALSTAVAVARADECADLYEGRSVTLVVPYNAGGGFDTYGRVMAPLLTDIMGQAVRVANISGGAGSIGQRTVANAAGGGIMIGFLNAGNLVAAYSDEDMVEDRLENFVTLGMVHQEPQAWIAAPGFEITPGMTIFAAVTNVAGGVYDTILPARAMGATMTPVSGYAGSGEAAAALLRGEVDIAAHSFTSSLRNIEANGFRMVFVLSNGPYPGAPEGVPYFAGPGGVADRMTRDLPAEERAERMRLARRSAAVTTSMRGLFVSKKTAPELVTCLKADVEELIFSDAFRQAAAEQRRPVSPLSGDDAQKVLEDARDSVLALRDEVSRILEEQD